MLKRLNEIEKDYLSLKKKLEDPLVIQNIVLMTKLAKEQALLTDTYNLFQEYKNLIEQIKENKTIIDDPEIGSLAQEELIKLNSKKEEIEVELKDMIRPKDPNDDKNVIMEIRGAAGGDEANIFAGDLYRMYTRYAESNGWKIEVLNEEASSVGGFTKVEFLIKGQSVYQKLKYESGSHRVQRIPLTETQGRVHTSTAVVLVMPEATEIDIEIKPSDLKIDVFKSGGAGGQSVNTTDSAVRITYLPTNIVVTCQNERSQIQNRERALEILKNKLYNLEKQKQTKTLEQLKGDNIDINFGSQIRSYILHPYTMVKDHRTNTEIGNANSVLDGNIDLFIYNNLRKGLGD